MINANELRLGNWANKHTGGTVTEHKEDFVQVTIELLNYCELLYPIPLSPDILLSAGFEIHSKNSFWTFILPNKWSISMWMEDEPCAGFEKKGVCYYGENYVEVKHLHQLQNLIFALTGTEITINLADVK